ncbi:MAG: hypothetical protein HY394_02950 [Candidatus Diapherotrites archaeon]|nr:hypothetical protein [Candidatus Diapherotrites archaeon]
MNRKGKLLALLALAFALLLLAGCTESLKKQAEDAAKDLQKSGEKPATEKTAEKKVSGEKSAAGKKTETGSSGEEQGNIGPTNDKTAEELQAEKFDESHKAVGIPLVEESFSGNSGTVLQFAKNGSLSGHKFLGKPLSLSSTPTEFQVIVLGEPGKTYQVELSSGAGASLAGAKSVTTGANGVGETTFGICGSSNSAAASPKQSVAGNSLAGTAFLQAASRTIIPATPGDGITVNSATYIFDRPTIQTLPVSTENLKCASLYLGVPINEISGSTVTLIDLGIPATEKYKGLPVYYNGECSEDQRQKIDWGELCLNSRKMAEDNAENVQCPSTCPEKTIVTKIEKPLEYCARRTDSQWGSTVGYTFNCVEKTYVKCLPPKPEPPKECDITSAGNWTIGVSGDGTGKVIVDPTGGKTSDPTGKCSEDWSCNEWTSWHKGICQNGKRNDFRSRDCTDANDCGTSANKPEDFEFKEVSCTEQSEDCTEDWQCGEWSVSWGACSNGNQTGTATRICQDNNLCETEANKPATTEPRSQACGDAVSCTESWTCGEFGAWSNWGECSNSSQSRTRTKTCTDANSCGTTNNRPALTETGTQSCVSKDYHLKEAFTSATGNGSQPIGIGETNFSLNSGESKVFVLDMSNNVSYTQTVMLTQTASGQGVALNVSNQQKYGPPQATYVDGAPGSGAVTMTDTTNTGSFGDQQQMAITIGPAPENLSARITITSP